MVYDRPDEQPEEQPYEAPELTRYGTLADLTKSGHGGLGGVFHMYDGTNGSLDT